MEEQRSLLCLNYCPSVFSDICNASEIDEPNISDVNTTYASIIEADILDDITLILKERVSYQQTKRKMMEWLSHIK